MARPCRPIPTLSEKDKKRFLSKLKVNESTGCHEWQAYTNQNGYGVIYVQWSYILSHRVAYFLDYGQQPGDLCVCHKCDNPVCCNPAHLFLGTTQENTRDMVEKGRYKDQKGTANGNAILTPQAVIQIRKLSAQGVKQKELAGMFGVNQSAISGIILHRTWTHLSSAKEIAKVAQLREQQSLKAGECSGGSILNTDSVLKIRELHSAGVISQKDMANMFGVNPRTISAVVHRRTWKHI